MQPPLHNLHHQRINDPDAVAEAAARTAPLREFHSRVPRRSFYWWLAHLPLDGAELMSTSGGGALLLPAGERWAFGSHSAAVVTLPSHGLAQAAALQALVGWIDRCVACDPGLPARLGAGDSLLRQVAVLLDPGLLLERPGESERLRERAGRSAFDDLIDHIRANLHQPLRLSDLEARSHYSRRALQYAFQQKLGCSPMAWIRRQRLERALAQLESGAPELTLQAVALACGYRHQGHFSREFQRRFGLPPSAVRRQRL